MSNAPAAQVPTVESFMDEMLVNLAAATRRDIRANERKAEAAKRAARRTTPRVIGTVSHPGFYGRMPVFGE